MSNTPRIIHDPELGEKRDSIHANVERKIYLATGEKPGRKTSGRPHGKVDGYDTSRKDVAAVSAAARHTPIRSLSVIFLAACALNLVWEHVHSNLYIHYKGGEITDVILLRAALFDAAVITLAGFFVLGGYMKRWHAIGILLLFAIGLEVFALHTGRWAYNEYMPMIPVLRTGLTPTIQLALLAYGAFFAASLQRRRT